METANKDRNLQVTIGTAARIAKLFIAWNVGVFIVAVLLRNSIAHDAVAAVFIRGAVYAVGGGILLYLLSQMSHHVRSGWVRLRIITALAPLGVIAFVLLTPDLPVWFSGAQVVSACLLAGIAFLIRGSALRVHFPRS